MESVNRPSPTFKFDLSVLFFFLAMLGLYICFKESLEWMYKAWTTKEEYSHGIMIPMVCAYLLWQRKAELKFDYHVSNYLGLLVLALGLAFNLISQLATLYVGSLIGFVLCFYGLMILALGVRRFRSLGGPFVILLLMIPLPTFIYNNLSSYLQLLSSEIGVAFIRLFDISVYLEGNVIDLGSYKLQVVDACSGLRYLFPLMALGLILAYVAKIPVWQKLLLFVMSAPITVLMNSLRVGGIGVTVEYWGPSMAEGLLHDIEGWFMFMASLVCLIVFLQVMLRVSGDKRGALQVISEGVNREDWGMASDIGLTADEPNQEAPSETGAKKVRLPISLISGVLLLSGFAMMQDSFSNRHEPEHFRLDLSHFPLFIGEWRGVPDALENVYIDALKFDDYMIANYSKGAERINFYIAYYANQSAGQSAHSPRSCIPGGGWRIQSLDQVHLGGLYMNSQPLMSNRAIIQKGDSRQVVYYWFQQRGRIVTNEYLVKWYLFVDSFFDNRTDGALVRLSLPLDSTKDISHADRVATDFMSSLVFRMNDFIPH